MTERVGGVRRVAGTRRTEWRRAGDGLGGEAAVTEWRAAWAAALDELEDDVRRAESLLQHAGTAAGSDVAVPAAPALQVPAPRAPASTPPGATASSGWALRRYGVTPAAPAVDMPMGALPAGSPAEPVAPPSAPPADEEIFDAELLDMPGEPADLPGMPDLDDFAAPWQPPALGGPLPEDLRDRATSLLNRQLAAAEALTRSMSSGRRHIGLLDRMESGTDEPRSAYLDQSC